MVRDIVCVAVAAIVVGGLGAFAGVMDSRERVGPIQQLRTENEKLRQQLRDFERACADYQSVMEMQREVIRRQNEAIKSYNNM